MAKVKIVFCFQNDYDIFSGYIIHCGVFVIDMFLYLSFHNGHLFKFGTIWWVTFNPALNNPAQLVSIFRQWGGFTEWH